MRDFFKPWRRKVGVVTLVMALSLIPLWFRSHQYYERVRHFCHAGTLQVASLHGRVFISRSRAVPDSDVSVEFDLDDISRWQGFDPRKSEPGLPFDPLNNLILDWRWDWMGFHYGVRLPDGLARSETYTVPYVAIVFLLTVLSAYLLLSKPRPSAPKQTTELSPTTGASHV